MSCNVTNEVCQECFTKNKKQYRTRAECASHNRTNLISRDKILEELNKINKE